MEQDQTPVNFDFINSQQPSQQKKPLDRRIVIIVVLMVLLVIMGLVILFTGSEGEKQSVDTKVDYTTAESRVDQFFASIRNRDDVAAYRLLDEDSRVSSKFFDKSAQFLRTKVNTEGCTRSGASELENGYELVYNCQLVDGSGSITLEFTLANKDNELVIVQYQQIGIENEI